MKKHIQAVMVAVVFIAIVAVADRLWGMDKWAESSQYTVQAFWIMVYSAMFLMGGIYYSVKKDKSEALLIVLIPMILLLFGLEDILYFMLFRETIPLQLPWLSGIPLFIANVLGQPVVTNVTLVISLGIGLVISYILIKKLEEW